MANTYTQLYVQLVFVVKYRQSLIHSSWEDQLYRYMTGVLQGRKHKMLAINGMPDHTHIFFGLHPEDAITSLVRELKRASTNFINKEKLCQYKFQWQTGYGAFTYNHDQSKKVIKYVLRQKEHHRTHNLREEYLAMLNAYQVDYQQEYLFDFLDDNLE